MRNLNLLFRKTYYAQLGSPEFGKQVEKNNFMIFSARFLPDRDHRENPAATHRVYLKTLYPGLLVGSGYEHQAGQADEELKLGFSFDYVSGQPYIPGSSVKGVLRSQFREHPELIAALTGWEISTVRAVERDIFDDQDIFFDAVVYDSNEYGELLGPDYITPHKSPVKDPVPIRFLKVLPDVTFEFCFRLNSSELPDGTRVTAGKKCMLFGQILELVGAGAKTNVGYGHFELLGKAPDVSAPKKSREKNAGAPVRKQADWAGKTQKPAVGSSGKPNPERVACPHCGQSNYKFYPDGNLRRKCYRCQGFLYPRGGSGQ